MVIPEQSLENNCQMRKDNTDNPTREKREREEATMAIFGVGFDYHVQKMEDERWNYMKQHEICRSVKFDKTIKEWNEERKNAIMVSLDSHTPATLSTYGGKSKELEKLRTWYNDQIRVTNEKPNYKDIKKKAVEYNIKTTLTMDDVLHSYYGLPTPMFKSHEGTLVRNDVHERDELHNDPTYYYVNKKQETRADNDISLLKDQQPNL